MEDFSCFLCLILALERLELFFTRPAVKYIANGDRSADNIIKLGSGRSLLYVHESAGRNGSTGI